MATGSDSAKEGEDDEEKGKKGANENKEAIKKKGAHMWSVGIDTT